MVKLGGILESSLSKWSWTGALEAPQPMMEEAWAQKSCHKYVYILVWACRWKDDANTAAVQSWFAELLCNQRDLFWFLSFLVYTRDSQCQVLWWDFSASSSHEFSKQLYVNACDFNTTCPLQQLHLDQKAMPRWLNWTDSKLLSLCGISWFTWLRPVKFTLFLESKESVRQEPVQYSKIRVLATGKPFEHLILWVLKTLISWKVCNTNTISTFSGPAASYDIFKSTSCCAAPPWFIYHRSWIVIWVHAFVGEVVLEFHLSILTRAMLLGTVVSWNAFKQG